MADPTHHIGYLPRLMCFLDHQDIDEGQSQGIANYHHVSMLGSSSVLQPRYCRRLRSLSGTVPEHPSAVGITSIVLKSWPSGHARRPNRSSRRDFYARESQIAVCSWVLFLPCDLNSVELHTDAWTPVSSQASRHQFSPSGSCGSTHQRLWCPGHIRRRRECE